MSAPLDTAVSLPVALAGALARNDLGSFRALVDRGGRGRALQEASARLATRLPATSRRTLQADDWLGAATVGDVLIRLCATRVTGSGRGRDALSRALESLRQAVVDLVLAEPPRSSTDAGAGSGAGGGTGPTATSAPRPHENAPRGDAARLQAWAERQGLSAYLVADLYDFVAAHAAGHGNQPGLDGPGLRALRPLRGQSTVRDALVPGSPGEARLAWYLRRKVHVLSAAQHHAAAALTRLAWERFAGSARAGARTELIARSPVHPSLGRLATALSELLTRFEARGDLPPEVPPLHVDFEPDRPGLRVTSKPSRHTGNRTIDTRVLLDVYPASPPRLWCQCGRTDCPHLAAALDALVPFLLELRQPSRALPELPALLEELQRPAWRRALAALVAASPVASQTSGGEGVEPDQSASRLTFRLYRGDDTVVLEPLLHKPLRSGRWSSGTRVGQSRMRTMRLTGSGGPPLRRALRLLGAAAPAERQLAVVEALEVLAESRCVFLPGDEHPVTIRRGTLGLTARATEGGGVRVVPAVGADEMPWSMVRRLVPGAPLLHIDEPRRLALIADVEGATLTPLRALSSFPGEFPQEAVPELWATLHRLGARLPLHLPLEVLGARVDEDRRLLVRMELRASELRGELAVRPLGAGPAHAPGDGPPRLTGIRDGGRVHVERDLPGELARASRVRTWLQLPPPTAGDPWRFSFDTDDHALDFALRLQSHEAARALDAELPELIVEWPRAAARRVLGVAGFGALRLRVTEHAGGSGGARFDWLGLQGGIEVAGHHVALADLLDAVRAGRRYVAVDGEAWIAIESQLRDRLLEVADLTHAGSVPAAEAPVDGPREETSSLAASVAAAPLLAALAEQAGAMQIDDAFRARFTRAQQAQVEEPPVPPELAGVLRPYQVEGFRWLMRRAAWGVGCCLADDMGLGKTLQALALLAARAPLGPALVVTPTSLCWSWVEEAARFVPSLRVVRFAGPPREARSAAMAPAAPLALAWQPGELVIASYGQVAQHAERLAGCRFATLILDEAQAIKNAATARAQAVRLLRAEVRVALSGTPVENHVGELWSLLDTVAPAVLGTARQFRERFAQPRQDRSEAEQRAALARLVRPLVLRRSKAEVAPELPPRTEVQRLVTPEAEEREHYHAVRLALVTQLQRATRGAGAQRDRRFAVLAAITRLRMLACHPRLVDRESTLPSAKLAAFLELVDELREGGHRALVFSQFTSHLALVGEALHQRAVPTLYLDGGTPEWDRATLVNRFQRGEGELFLISLKAGGTGLNLTAADYVIHLDPWWNPAVEDQATDRAHRIGQTRPVTIYRLVSRGTIEESIVALHHRKRDLATSLLAGTDLATPLSTEEMLELMRQRATQEGGDEEAGT